MISKENAEKFIKTGIYAKKRFESGWCINATFIPHFYPEKNLLYMRDSYWSSGESRSFEVTDDTIGDWSLIIDTEKWSKTHSSACWDYNKEDYIYLATDSGGWSYAHYFLKNGATPNIDKQIYRVKSELESSKRDTERLEKELAELVAKKGENL